LVLTTQKVLKFTMKNNLTWKTFKIFWPEILHFKRVKMSETTSTCQVWQRLIEVQKGFKAMNLITQGSTMRFTNLVKIHNRGNFFNSFSCTKNDAYKKNATKNVKYDSKIIISIYKSKSVKHIMYIWFQHEIFMLLGSI
jgi:hypothetical protein